MLVLTSFETRGRELDRWNFCGAQLVRGEQTTMPGQYAGVGRHQSAQ